MIDLYPPNRIVSFSTLISYSARVCCVNCGARFNALVKRSLTIEQALREAEKRCPTCDCPSLVRAT